MSFSNYSFFDKIIEGVQIINSNWQYVYVNDAAAIHAKAKKEELIGHTMMEKYPGIENTEMFKSVRDCMDYGAPKKMINELDFPDGAEGSFELRMQRIDGGVLVLSFDVTKQKQLEKLLQNANTFLDEKVKQRTAELTLKNNELEQFAYIASHDLQEPLRTVSNYVQALHEDCGKQLDDAASQYLDAIHHSVQRMGILLNALLEYSRLGRNKKLEYVDSGKIINDVKTDLENLIETSGAVIKVSPMPRLNVYEPEMRQLFQNLIANAIKFRKKNIRPEIQIGCEPVDENWKFFVRDNGIGIEQRHFGRIFQIFQRLHSADEYDGNGVGLANCKKITELHGGKIWIESEPGKGSVINFTIPKLEYE